MSRSRAWGHWAGVGGGWATCARWWRTSAAICTNAAWPTPSISPRRPRTAATGTDGALAPFGAVLVFEPGTMTPSEQKVLDAVAARTGTALIEADDGRAAR